MFWINYRSYCDDICKANDGFSQRLRPGIEDSPSIMASLPALLASNIKHNSRPRGQGASASTSSQSETSSPLQSPSPFAHPVLGLEASPKEDAFTLPPPLYPQPIYANAFQSNGNGQGNGHGHHPTTSSNPVRISSSYSNKTASPGIELSNSHHRESFKDPHDLSGTPTKGGMLESTLRYGRRPAVTNSVTSPLAFIPIGSTKRQQADAHMGGPRNNILGSPAFAPLRNVSDSSVVTRDGLSGGGEGKRRSFAYGTHSPLLLAANASRPPSSAVDFSNASATRLASPLLQASSSTAALKSAQNGSSNVERQSRSGSRPRIPVKETSLDTRRKSFPAHILAGLRPRLMSSATQLDARTVSNPVIASDSEEESTPVVELNLDLNDKDNATIDSRRGRSRERKMSVFEREDSRSRSDRAPSSHLGLDGMNNQPRTGRSRSGMRRDSAGRDRKRSHGRRPRDRSRSSERERSSGDEYPSRMPQPVSRDSYYNPELDTIVGSTEADLGQSPERGRNGQYARRRESSPLATIKASRQHVRPANAEFSPRYASPTELQEDRAREGSRSRAPRDLKHVDALIV
jgi:hypothetical protein